MKLGAQFVKGVLFSLGGLAILLGLVWIGQGTGIFRYPSNSFMIDQTRWAWRGLGLAVAGGLLLVAARRM
jgi:hypothetical protein